MLAKLHFPAKPLLLTPVLLSMLTAACVFGGNDAKDTPTPEATVPSAPAIGRSGAEATATPIGGTEARPTRVIPTPVAPTAGPAQSPIDGLVSVVYTYPFIWPVEGPITSFMSPEHPNGIDIGLENNATRTIRAAASGTVTHAGGDNDQPLGISITIDHGNGVTTVYGHLSQLQVKVGDKVEIGQTIGIGGSTGIATGPHLHFEVRKNGDTVDPLHVLPTSDNDTASYNIDCATTPFTLPSGAEALLDFSGVLSTDEKITDVSTTSKNGGPSLDYSIANNTEVQLKSAIDFDGPNEVDSYALQVTVDYHGDHNQLECPFTVQRQDVPTTFYVRADPPASNVEGGNTSADATGTAEPGATDSGAGATSEPTPEVTPTPNPWAGTPSYQVPSSNGGASPTSSGTPASSGGAAQAPSYGVPSSGGGAAQAPSYGIPSAGASPTPKP